MAPHEALYCEIVPTGWCLSSLSSRALGRRHPRWEPDAVTPLVRICGGGHEQSWSLLRLSQNQTILTITLMACSAKSTHGRDVPKRMVQGRFCNSGGLSFTANPFPVGEGAGGPPTISADAADDIILTALSGGSSVRRRLLWGGNAVRIDRTIRETRGKGVMLDCLSSRRQNPSTTSANEHCGSGHALARPGGL
jgi:hypothetical protein